MHLHYIFQSPTYIDMDSARTIFCVFCGLFKLMRRSFIGPSFSQTVTTDQSSNAVNECAFFGAPPAASTLPTSNAGYFDQAVQVYGIYSI